MVFRSLFFTLAVGTALPLLGADTARAEPAPSMDQSITPVSAAPAELASASTTAPASASTTALASAAPTAPVSAAPAATAAGAGPDTAAASASAGPDGRWQASVYGSWMPGIGEAKRGALEGGPPGGAPGYGIRLEKSLHDWWSAGLMLSSRSWEIDAPAAATGLLSNGSFLDAAVMVKFHPLRFSLAGGPLGVYLAAAGGPTLAGSKRSYSAATAEGAASSDSVELLSFDAGYNTSAWLGASWLPTEHWGLFVEGGFDWHFAVHSRNTVDFAQPLAAADQPSAIAEKLWLAQGMLNVGALYRF